MANRPGYRRPRLPRRVGRIVSLLWVAGVLALAVSSGRAQDAPPLVVQTDVEGAIGPAVADHVIDSLESAQERDAALLLLRMDTPGGLSTAMRDMITAILGSDVPVATYVAPSGARAASAGLYILYASHVAAMAPGTNTGAATPVSVGGGGLPGTGGGQDGGTDDGPADRDASSGGGSGEGGSGEGGTGDDGEAAGDAAPQTAPADPHTAKAVNDAVAYIRSLAELRGRNADWAERAVREAASLSAERAVEMDVADLIAQDRTTLLTALDGRTVTVSGAERTLALAGASVETMEPGVVNRILRVLSNPNLALLLMTLGFYGLVFELANPGLGPGIPGVILLVLGLYSLNQLPLDYAGLALIGVGLAAMAFEAVTPTFGVLGISGAAAFTVGAAILVETDSAQFQIAWGTIAGVALTSLAALSLLLGYLLRTQFRPAAQQSGMIGAEARVLEWTHGSGHVHSHGERWCATGPADLARGETARVTGIDGLTLILARHPKEES